MECLLNRILMWVGLSLLQVGSSGVRRLLEASLVVVSTRQAAGTRLSVALQSLQAANFFVTWPYRLPLHVTPCLLLLSFRYHFPFCSPSRTNDSCVQEAGLPRVTAPGLLVLARRLAPFDIQNIRIDAVTLHSELSPKFEPHSCISIANIKLQPVSVVSSLSFQKGHDHFLPYRSSMPDTGTVVKCPEEVRRYSARAALPCGCPPPVSCSLSLCSFLLFILLICQRVLLIRHTGRTRNTPSILFVEVQRK
jgi:hypothetical protein